MTSKHTLFVTDSMYDLQTRFKFDCGNMQAVGQEILTIPQNEGDTLLIKLIVEPGGNLPEAIHDFHIGEFPSGIPNWWLSIMVVDNTGNDHGKIKVAQTTAEAEPRPLGTGILR